MKRRCAEPIRDEFGNEYRCTRLLEHPMPHFAEATTHLIAAVWEPDEEPWIFSQQLPPKVMNAYATMFEEEPAE